MSNNKIAADEGLYINEGYNRREIDNIKNHGYRKYPDPTAEEAICNVLKEEAKKAKDKRKGKV